MVVGDCSGLVLIGTSINHLFSMFGLGAFGRLFGKS